MTGPRVRQAQNLLADLPRILEDGGLIDPGQVTITQDSTAVDKANLRAGVIVLQPGPPITYPMPGVHEVAWRLDVVGSPTDLVDTWDRLDSILHALRLGGLPLEEAQPGGLPRPDPAPDLPGYLVTLRHQYLDTE